MVAVGDGDPAVVVATLRQALEALTRLSAERAGLEEALKVCSAAAWSGIANWWSPIRVMAKTLLCCHSSCSDGVEAHASSIGQH